MPRCVDAPASDLRLIVANMVGVEGCRATATMALHRHELEFIITICCHGAARDEALGFFA